MHTLAWFDADPARRRTDADAHAAWDKLIAACEQGATAAARLFQGSRWDVGRSRPAVQPDQRVRPTMDASGYLLRRWTPIPMPFVPGFLWDWSNCWKTSSGKLA